MKKFIPVVAVATAVLLVGDVAYAQEAANYAPVGKGIAIGFAALGVGLGQGLAARGMNESIGRNPAAAGALFVPFIIGMALMESIALLAIFVNGI